MLQTPSGEIPYWVDPKKRETKKNENTALYRGGVFRLAFAVYAYKNQLFLFWKHSLQ